MLGTINIAINTVFSVFVFVFKMSSCHRHQDRFTGRVPGPRRGGALRKRAERTSVATHNLHEQLLRAC